MPTPGSILNITSLPGGNHFSVQVAPTGAPDYVVHSMDEIAAGYDESPYFTANGAGTAVQFYARADAPTTSGATTARCELREADESGNDIAFSPFDGNMHRIKGTSTITHHPTSGTSIDGIGIVLAQVHNGNRDRLSFRTQFVSGTLRLRWRENGAAVWQGTNTTSSSGTTQEVASGTANATGTNIWNSSGTISWPWEIQIYNGNGTTCTVDFYVNGTLWRRNTAFTNTDAGFESTWYAKAGCYNQFNASNVAATEYGQVELRGLEHWHTGWPTPSVGGGGGGSGLPATVREVVSNSSSGLSGNLSVTTSSTTAVGDTLVVFEMREYGSPGDMPNPTGTAGTWTSRIATPIDNVALSCWTRPVTVAGAQTVTVTGNADTPGCVLVAVVVKDCTAVGNAAGANNITAGTTHTAPTVTAVDSNELLLCAWAASEEENYTPPGTMTSIVTPTTGVDGGTFVTMLVASQALTAPGATGTRVATGDASAAQATGSILLRGSTAVASSNAWLAFFG